MRIGYHVVCLNINVTVTKHVDFLQPVSCVFSVTCQLERKAELLNLNRQIMQILCVTTEWTVPSIQQCSVILGISLTLL